MKSKYRWRVKENGRAEIRVRFAPSPTGYLHVGGARTAIFNWLFARNSGGTFVLRIEDTDVERSTKDSEASLLKDLEWLGIEWDEGPVKGGPFSPYRQSERLSIYEREAKELVDKKLAYPCFCKEEDLEKKRKEAVAAGGSPHYDGTCRNLASSEIEKKREQGIPEVIRFRVPDGEIVFDDCIKGKIELSTSMVGDFVLIRSNGLPTYNFAAVVDDAAMKITHVLRGEEHLPNTLRQILLYEAIDSEPPVFGHLPLILGKDRSKLSKRHGASSIGRLRREGFLPKAVFNYLSLLGWSHSQEKEVLSVQELIEDFSLARVGKSPAIFDLQKMRWLNGMHIRKENPERVFALADEFFPADIKKAYAEEKRRKIFALLHEKIDTFSDIGAHCAAFAEEVSLDEEAREVLAGEKAKAVLMAFMSGLKSAGDDLSREVAKELIKKAGKRSGAKGRELYFPIRAALTGSVHGPDLAGLIAVKGKALVLSSLEKALGSG